MCFVGHDYQRIIDGINYWRMREPIEAIYLFYDKKRDPYGYASRRNTKDLEKALTFAGSKPKIIGINPQDYEEVFTSLYKSLKSEVIDNGRKVLIDATSTTKEAYGAAVTVSLMFPKVGIYIVPPAERGWYIPEPGTPEYENWFSRVRMRRGTQPQEIYLPGNRLEHPSFDEMKILLALIEHGGKANSIKSIIKWCKEDPTNPAVKNRYSRLIAKLVSKGLLIEEPSTRTKRVRLTEFGRVFAKALRLIALKQQPKKEHSVPAQVDLRSEETFQNFQEPITSRSELEITSTSDLGLIGGMLSPIRGNLSNHEQASRTEFATLLARLAREFKLVDK